MYCTYSCNELGTLVRLSTKCMLLLTEENFKSNTQAPKRVGLGYLSALTLPPYAPMSPSAFRHLAVNYQREVGMPTARQHPNENHLF